MKKRKIQIEKLKKWQQQYNNLYIKKLNAISRYFLNNKSTKLKDFEYIIELWKNKKGNLDELLSILILKKKYLESQKNSDKRKLFFLNKQIEQINLLPQIDFYSTEYIELLKSEIEELINNIDNETDEYIKVCKQIELFYKQDELNILNMKNVKYVSKQESDKIIDDKINNKYKVIIELLEKKVAILNNRIKTGYYKDEIDKIDAEILVHKLLADIEAKKEFIEQLKERKNIY